MKLLKKALLSIIIVSAAFIIMPQVIPELQEASSVQAASISISKKSMTLNVKQTAQLKIKGTNKKVKWSTKNSKIATVNSKGIVTAKGVGTVKIVAKVGGKNYVCTVKVENPKINVTSKSLKPGAKYQLKVSKTTQKIKWSSSNKSVATVNSKGVVVAKKKGSAIISAKVGNKTLKCTIKVTSANNISISKKSMTLNVKQTAQLNIKGTNKKVKWSTKNSKIATVNSKGKVTAKGVGTVKIVAKVGGKNYVCTVKVENPIINVTSKSLKPGAKYQLKVSKTTQKVKWASSNTSVATVNSKGVVVAKKKGSAIISAKVGNKTLQCYVKVESASYAKNISVVYQKTKTSVIGIFTNKNSVAVDFTPKMAFYDAKGKLQSTTSAANYCFEPNKTIALEFTSYNPSTFKNQTYSKFVLDKGIVKKSYYNTGSSKKIAIESTTKTNSSLKVKLKNKSGKKLDTIQVAAVFYDKNKKVIGYDYTYAHCYKKGTTDTVNLYYPYNNGYIKPASYKVYVNHAYAY